MKMQSVKGKKNKNKTCVLSIEWGSIDQKVAGPKGMICSQLHQKKTLLEDARIQTPNWFQSPKGQLNHVEINEQNKRQGIIIAM